MTREEYEASDAFSVGEYVAYKSNTRLRGLITGWDQREYWLKPTLSVVWENGYADKYFPHLLQKIDRRTGGDRRGKTH